jgi:hypothetical protein
VERLLFNTLYFNMSTRKQFYLFIRHIILPLYLQEIPGARLLFAKLILQAIHRFPFILFFA